MCRSFLKSKSETTLKSVDFDEVTDKNKLAPFMAHGVQNSFLKSPIFSRGCFVLCQTISGLYCIADSTVLSGFYKCLFMFDMYCLFVFMYSFRVGLFWFSMASFY